MAFDEGKQQNVGGSRVAEFETGYQQPTTGWSSFRAPGQVANYSPGLQGSKPMTPQASFTPAPSTYKVASSR